MFKTQSQFVSQQYSKIALRYNNLQDLSNRNTLESLLFKTIIFYADYVSEISIQQLFQKTKANTAQWLFCINTLSHQLYRELMFGPSVSYQSPEAKTININKQLKNVYQPLKHQECDYSALLKQFSIQNLVPWNINMYNVDYLKNPSFAIRSKRYLRDQLSIEGETWVDAIPYPHLFIILKQLIKLICETQEFTQNYKYLINARLNFLHNQILEFPVGSLSAIVLSHYKIYLENYLKNGQIRLTHYVAIKLEYSHVLLFYYKHIESERNLEICKQILNIDIEYTGKLGRRTKFQSFDIAQLVMNVTEYKTKQTKKSEQDYIDYQIIKQQREKLPKLQQVLKIDEVSKEGPKILELEEDSILYEIPKFTQEQHKQTNLTIQKQLTILAYAYNIFQSSPKDEGMFLKISSIVNPLLMNKNIPYSIKESFLILRSLNQFPRIKNADRALQQLQELVNQYNTLNKTDDDVIYLLSLPQNYNVHLLRLKLVGEKMMKHGLLMTGVQMLQKVGLFQDCVEGLIRANHKDRAIKMAKQLLKKDGGQGTPRLIYLIAQINNNDIEGYEKAWRVSGEKYAKAQIALGWIWFHKKQFQKSIKAYTKALKINFYNPNGWFTLGCAYMNVKNFEQAIKAFSQSICIDESQGEGWGNLASCYIVLKKLNEAYTTLEQAVKYCESSWKIWANLLGVSIKIKKFYKYFECIETLVNLDHSEIVSSDALAKVCQILRFKMDCFQTQRKRVIYAFRNRIQRLFDRLKTKIGQKPMVWKYYTEFLQIQITYYQLMRNHFIKVHEFNLIDPNDIVPNYDKPQQILIMTTQKIQELKDEIINSKQKQCNMLMSIGWQTDKKKCQQLVIAVKQLVSLHKANDKEQDVELGMFLKTVKQKIQNCLQKTIQF